jgi:tRNA(adenine34) deaminase
MDHEQTMRLALALAGEAEENGDVPVGCVIADADGKIIGKGRNRREESQDATAHAEIEAIREACQAKGSWRLDDCVLYVTLEPCPMCAGAIINARIPRVVFGAREENTGACGSVLDLFSENFHHRPAIYAGVCAEESRRLMNLFFRSRREESN